LIILGCAGMAGLQQAVGAAAGVPVVDPVVAAVALLASLARTGARTSKRNLYRPVDPRLHIEAPPGIRRAYEH
jgi:allantoin racemase